MLRKGQLFRQGGVGVQGEGGAFKVSEGPGRVRGGAVETSAQAVNLHKAFREQGLEFKGEAASY